ncbi:MAG: hypothetical protein ABSF85_00840 [Terriglobales bacterium]
MKDYEKTICHTRLAIEGHRPNKRDEISRTIFPRPRRTRREICGEKIKSELLQLAGAGDRSDFKFVESLFHRVPELKEY